MDKMNDKNKKYRVAVLPGDGIGPEICQQALKVIDKINERLGIEIATEQAYVGGAAIDAQGKALPDETIKLCQESDAILFGAVGGPKWEDLPLEQQPERAALLPLRKNFDLFANFRPAIIYPSLVDASPLKNHILQAPGLKTGTNSESLDLLIIRELTSDIYFGQPKAITSTEGMDTMRYTKGEIERIAHLAFAAARKRSNKVTSIDKANVLSTMVFWRKVVTEVAKNYPDVKLEHMYVDNAAMQLVRNPKQFDVLLSPNMFGDILSDEASMITGSIGMLPSASINQNNFGLYEPISGSAPDIAGQNIANPIAQVLSLSMLLDFSLGEKVASDKVKQAVDVVLGQGYRTPDIMKEGLREVSTDEMGNLIAAEVK